MVDTDIDILIMKHMPLRDIQKLERRNASSWNLIKGMIKKLNALEMRTTQAENYCLFLQKELKNAHEQNAEFGKALERIERELAELRRDVRNANVVVIE